MKKEIIVFLAIFSLILPSYEASSGDYDPDKEKKKAIKDRNEELGLIFGGGIAAAALLGGAAAVMSKFSGNGPEKSAIEREAEGAVPLSEEEKDLKEIDNLHEPIRTSTQNIHTIHLSNVKNELAHPSKEDKKKPKEAKKKDEEALKKSEQEKVDNARSKRSEHIANLANKATDKVFGNGNLTAEEKQLKEAHKQRMIATLESHHARKEEHNLYVAKEATKAKGFGGIDEAIKISNKMDEAQITKQEHEKKWHEAVSNQNELLKKHPDSARLKELHTKMERMHKAIAAKELQHSQTSERGHH